MATTPEGKVKQAVKKWLDKRGAYWYMVVPHGYSRVGVPDFIACLQGQFVGIETKAPGKLKNTTPSQDRELSKIASAGGVSLVVDDVSQLDAAFGEEHGCQSSHEGDHPSSKTP